MLEGHPKNICANLFSNLAYTFGQEYYIYLMKGLQYTKNNPIQFQFSIKLSHFLSVSHVEHHISLKRFTS